jgi:hypothetical protein
MRAFPALAGAIVLFAAFASAVPAHAGVVNPDLSVIGQPVLRWTDAAGDPARKRFVLDPGETEVVLDAPLNPYARGNLTLSFAAGAVSVEEAYFLVTRGLPLGLALKGGKYRAGFGKLNPQHPHAYPFADRPHVLAAYLPGADAFDESGLQLSEQFALPHDIALTVSGDWLQGDSFRAPRTATAAANDPLTLAGAAGDGDRAKEPRPAGLGRVSAFVPIGDRSGLELGSSYTQGTNNVAAAARTAVWGGDAKLKAWTGASAYLLVQAEALSLARDDANWDPVAAGYTRTAVHSGGGYAFADYVFNARYDAGASFESFADPAAGNGTASAFGAFAGLALMEETTSFRIGWERFRPASPGIAYATPAAAPAATNTVTIRVIYSMGPHKAHQF